MKKDEPINDWYLINVIGVRELSKSRHEGQTLFSRCAFPLASLLLNLIILFGIVYHYRHSAEMYKPRKAQTQLTTQQK